MKIVEITPRPLNFILDLDNTLCQCSRYYIDAKAEFSELMSKKTGIDPTTAKRILEGIDSASIRIYGVGRKRFPLSFFAASAAIDIIMGRSIGRKQAEKAAKIAKKVFTAEYPLYKGVWETLVRLKNERYNLFLCTMGDYNVQFRKLKKNNLFEIFPRSHVYIGTEKTAESFQAIIDEHHLNVQRTVVVGDSIGVDICPAKEVGAISVHINNDDQVTVHDEKPCTPDYKIAYFSELPTILEKLNS